MANRHINKGNEPICASGIDNSNSGILPCYSCYSAILDDKSELNQRVKGKSACYWVLLFVLFLEARTDKSQLNQQVNTKNDRAIPSLKPAKLDESQEPALKFIGGLLAEYGSVAGNSNRAKQVLLAGVSADIKSEALRQVELLKDDIEAQRLVLQSYTDRMIAVGELILDEKDKLTLSQGRTPARRGRAGAQLKGGMDTMDYRRAAAVLSRNHAHYAKHGSNIISQAEAIRTCQSNGEPLFLGGHGEASLRRSVSQGLRKHFPNEAKHWTRTKKP